MTVRLLAPKLSSNSPKGPSSKGACLLFLAQAHLVSNRSELRWLNSLMRWRVAVRNGKAREASTTLWETVGAMLGRINVAACPLFSASSHVMLYSRFFIFISSLNRELFSLIHSYYYIKNSLHIVDTSAPHTHQAQIGKRTFHLPPHCLPASGTVAILMTFVKTIWRVHKFSRNLEPSQHFTRQKHDMKQVTRWGPTNITCHGAKFSRLGELVPWDLCTPG